MKKIVIIGAGGHAHVLVDVLQSDPAVSLRAVVDQDSETWGSTVLSVPVVGNDDCLAELFASDVHNFVVAIGGVHQAALRRRLFEQTRQLGFSPYSVQHRSAVYSKRAHLGAGVQLLAHCVVNTGAILGDNVLINTGAIVEHDCVVESHAHIAPRACLAGGVKISWGAHIGLGAVVKENISIGEQAVVGAGAVVIDDVPPCSVVVGVPARQISNQSSMARPRMAKEVA